MPGIKYNCNFVTSHIFQALGKCKEPDMIDQILAVLYKEEYGNQRHAEKLSEIYRGHIAQHKNSCKKCKYFVCKFMFCFADRLLVIA